MGVAGIVLAILGLALTIIPNIGAILATLCIGAGLILSTIGVFQNKRRDPGFKPALLGIIVNIAAIAVIFLWIYLFDDTGILGGWDPDVG